MEPKFMHYRFINADGAILSRGGMTIAYTEVNPGEFRVAGAKCHPRDNFEKAQGRLKSSARLVEGSQSARGFNGSESSLVAALNSDIAMMNLYYAPQGVQLVRKFNGRRKRKDETGAAD